RAFDRERIDTYRADGDWRRALVLWHRLWLAGDFWQGLRRFLSPDGPDPLPAPPAAWPGQLLPVHFHIAFDGPSPMESGRRHVEMALSSAFPDEVKERVRQRAYDAWLKRVPPAAWEANTIDDETLQPALEAVSLYLQRDATYLRAMRDLLYLLWKWS